MRTAGTLLLAFMLALPCAAGESDCSFNPEAYPTPAEVWRRVSREAELGAPASSRRRASGPAAQSIKPKNFIDDEIFGKMSADGIRWTSPATDAEFLRRVSLDLTGQIPTADRVKEFLADTRSDKRDRLVDELLASEEFVERWTLWLGDHVQNVRISSNINMGVEGRNAYYTFLLDSFRTNKSYDQIVRELITGSGAQNTSGPANYWVRQIQTNGPIQDTWDNLAAHSAEKFLGLPLECVSCHSGVGHLEQVNSGLVAYTRNDFWETAAFFAREYHRPQRDESGRVEWHIEETPLGLPRVPRGYRLNTDSGNKTPREAMPFAPTVVQPSFILSDATPAAGERPREAYARILTADPQFARASVNYLWKEIFGLGIVEPADSFDLLKQDSQPTHPRLLTRLAEHFSGSGFDLRAFLKTIVTSNTYGLSSTYTAGEWNEQWTPYYARHYPKRMLAESVADAIARATGVPLPRMVTAGNITISRAVGLPDPTEPRGGGLARFLAAFGRGDRDSTRRSSEGSIIQALSLLNDPLVTTRVRASGDTTVQRILTATRDAGTIADELYIATLSRMPSAEERAEAIEWLRSGDLVPNTEDLQFALLNRLEFLYD
jgi:hypothetical protein